MSEENKEGRTVRDLKPEKDVKGGIGGTEPPQSEEIDKSTLKLGSKNPVPPITGPH